jgi:hypothetical protein
MLFSFRIGSAGEGALAYSVRLPFTLSPGRTIVLPDDSGRFELLGHTCEIFREHNQYALTVSGFDSEDAAATFLLKTCAGLIWFGLKSSLGLRFNPDMTPIEIFSQSKPIAAGSHIASIAANKGWSELDGQYDADKTVIIPQQKKLIIWATGSATVRLDTPVPVLSAAMLEGMAEGQPELVLRNAKLRLACDVYLSSYFDSTPAASFLSRITTLEILSADAPASDSVRKMVERFIADAADVQKKETDAAVRRELESLLSRLAYLRYQSIRSGIRSLLEETLRNDPEIAAPAEVSKEVSHLYDLRSTLVHSGEVDPAAVREGNNRLNAIVPRVLRALFRKTAGRE